MSTERTEWGRSAVLGCLVFGAVLLCSVIPILESSLQRISDTYFALPPGHNHSGPKPIVILIDDESLQRYGRWPWNREDLAQLLRNLDKANAGVIGLDILLSEPQPGGSDTALENAIRKNGRTILVDKIGSSSDGPRWNEPLEQFAQAALSVGHAQALLDRDGVCRRFPAYEMTLEGRRWAFAIEAARRTDPEQAAKYLAAYGLEVKADNQAVVYASPIAIPISFRVEDFETFSAAKIMSGESLPDLQRRPILVGFGPTEIGDRIITPVSDRMPSPGILVHAQILNNILSGRTLLGIPTWVRVPVLLAVSVLAVVGCRSLKGWKVLVIAAGGSLLAYGTGWVLFRLGWLAPAGQWMLVFLLAPLVSYSSDSVLVERHVMRQLRALHVWLSNAQLTDSTHTPANLGGRMEMVGRLQDRLGSLYEVHEALLSATDDAIGVFDSAGNLLLSNEVFMTLMGSSPDQKPTLKDVRACIGYADGVAEGETRLKEDLYSYRFVALPPTVLSPSGGTIARFASLKMREQRDRARSEALGFVTHELRTPLVAIQGLSELMMRYPGSPGHAGAPENIFNESKRLLALINSYLEVLQVDSGKALASRPVLLKPLAQQAIATIAPLAAPSEMSFSLAIEDRTIVVGDEILIGGAILNLLSNAVKYGQPKTEISVRVHESDDATVVSVRNFGPPISASEEARIFDPYYRAANASAEQTGWGLGLAFVKRIMEKHCGSVAVSSDQVNGTVFELRFPRASSAKGHAGGAV